MKHISKLFFLSILALVVACGGNDNSIEGKKASLEQLKKQALDLNAQIATIEKELAKINVPLVRTGSPYAVAPFRVTKDDGTPYRVFTPFYRTWLKHGWRKPAEKFKKY